MVLPPTHSHTVILKIVLRIFCFYFYSFIYYYLSKTLIISKQILILKQVLDLSVGLLTCKQRIFLRKPQFKRQKRSQWHYVKSFFRKSKTKSEYLFKLNLPDKKAQSSKSGSFVISIRSRRQTLEPLWPPPTIEILTGPLPLRLPANTFA